MHEDILIDIDGNLDGGLTNGLAGQEWDSTDMFGQIDVGGSASGTIHFRNVGDPAGDNEGLRISIGAFTGSMEIACINGEISISSLSGTLEALNNGNVFVGVGVGDDGTVWAAFPTGATISISSLSTNSNIFSNKGGSVAFTEGDITIAEQMKGSISITADYKGDIAIEGDDGLESGVEIDISGDLVLSGSVSINHELAGLLEVHDDPVNPSGGSIDVLRMAPTGRMLFSQSFDGDIAVQRDTGINSLIQIADGLYTGGTLRLPLTVTQTCSSCP